MQDVDVDTQSVRVFCMLVCGEIGRMCGTARATTMQISQWGARLYKPADCAKNIHILNENDC